jgi:hypothetical protein
MIYSEGDKIVFNIFMCRGLAWRIRMGSGFNDWMYWYLFTITVDYNSSQIQLLNDICLPNLSLVCR